MKIYYTRHGENTWNATNRVCGISDIPLNEKGIEQAHSLSEKIAANDDIDIIISSPLIRAKKTADIISKKINKPVIVDKRFTEWDYGKYEGCDRYGSYEKEKPSFQKAKLEFGIRIGETGESLLQLAHRVYTAIEDVIKQYSNKNILIVAHGGVCRVIETYYRDMTIVDFSKYFLGHCELKCWEIS